jgi:hypothetical protein
LLILTKELMPFFVSTQNFSSSKRTHQIKFFVLSTLYLKITLS